MTYSVLWKIHAILMSLSFITMGGGIIISLMSKKIKGSFKIHKKLGITATITGVTALLIAFVMVQVIGGPHLSGLHSYLGAITALMLICTPLLILYKKNIRKKPIRKAHKILGYLTLSLMALTIFFGLSMMGLLSLFN